MYRRLLLVTVILSIVLSFSSQSQDLLPSPTYVPPDLATYGEEAHYRDMAIIETSGSSFMEVRDFWMELTRRGALIAVITSPQRMVGWVPRESYDNVLSTRLETATGDIRVLSISYTASEFRAKTVYRNSVMSETSEADETLVDFLDFIKRKKTPEDIQRIKEREWELRLLEENMPPPNCVGVNVLSESDIQDMKSKAEIQGGPGAKIFRATRPLGLIAHTSFFLESKSGTGTWNWNSTVYLRYKIFYIVGMSYWTSFAAKFGKTSSGLWRLYGRTHSATQITGEPTAVGEDSFVPTVIGRLWSGTRPTWGWARTAVKWCWPYNNYIRTTLGTDEAISGFIAYKGSGSESIWPHAEVICWGGCDNEREGVYFALDTQYWQAGHNPFDAPRRNVFAHEIGHLWGSPDEYADGAGCFNWTYRGIGNINCQRKQPARGRPGLFMTGSDGMMMANYLGGHSIAQPIHTGVISAANATPIRCFMTVPANIPVIVKQCDDGGNRTYTTTMCQPVDYDYCAKVRVPLTRNISGTTYYFDKWRVTRRNGATTTFTNYANELPSYAWTSTKANPVVTVRAIFTSSPPDFKSANATLSAWLAPNSNAALPGRAIALKWRNKYDMSRTDTKIEFERTPGTWVGLDINNMTLRPFHVSIGQWTGAHIFSTPTSSGGNMPIQVNRMYKFRIVGYFNTIRGTPSSTASVITRPETPADTVFCYDSYEPNTLSSPKVLTSSGPGMVAYTIKAACPMIPRAGEWTWFVPKNDYYRITVINVSSTFFGQKLHLILRVRDGSKFKPRFRAQRAGTTSHINATYVGGAYHLRIAADGEYLIKVEPRISGAISNDLVDRTQGVFGFGEYEMTVERVTNNPQVTLLCNIIV
ncbi:MAG: hypothetical protein GXO82_10885 [Chlorobi bacterium]|nr:hypothetical protein [Chlorobiota bacterium]